MYRRYIIQGACAYQVEKIQTFTNQWGPKFTNFYKQWPTMNSACWAQNLFLVHTNTNFYKPFPTFSKNTNFYLQTSFFFTENSTRARKSTDRSLLHRCGKCKNVTRYNRRTKQIFLRKVWFMILGKPQGIEIKWQSRN